MGEVADLWVTLRANTAQFTGSMAKAAAEAETSGAKMSASVARYTNFAALGFGAVAIAGVKMASDFQASTLRFVTTAGESQKGLEQVRQGILNMTSQVGISAKNLGDAMYYVESGGFHGAAGLNVLADAAKAAQLEGSNVVDVAHALTGALNDYHGTTLTAAKATNAMTAAVGSGMMTFQDLAEAMPHIGSRAAAANVQFREMLAGIGTMTKDGLPASVAATYLGQTIGQLAAPSSKAATEMKKLGLNAHTVAETMTSGNGTGLADAINMVWDASSRASSIGQTQVQALALMTGGVRSYQGALMLGGKHANQYAETLQSINKQLVKGGDNIAGWNDRQKTFQQQWNDFSAGFQSDLINIGTRLLPDMSGALSVVNDVAGFFFGNATVFDTVAGAVTGAAVAFGLLKAAELAWAAVQVIGEIGSITAALFSLTTGIGATEMTWIEAQGVMEATPWGAILGGIGAVVGAFVAFGSRADDASQAAERQKQAVQTLAGTYNQLTGAITKATSAQVLHDLQGTSVQSMMGKGVVANTIAGAAGISATTSATDLASKMGINQNQLIQFAEGSAAAIRIVTDAINRYAATSGQASDQATLLRKMIGAETSTVDASSAAVKQNYVAQENLTKVLRDVRGGAQVANGAILSNITQVANLAEKYQWSGQQIQTVINAYWPPAMAQAQGVTVSAVQAIESAVGGLPTAMATAGRQAGAGFAGGLTLSYGSVVDAAAGMAIAAEHAVNKHLIIKSPSRLMYAKGAFAGEGLALGMESKVSRVTAAGQTMTAALLKGISKLGPSISKTTAELAYNAAQAAEKFTRHKGVHHTRGHIKGVLKDHHALIAGMEKSLGIDISAMSHERIGISKQAHTGLWDARHYYKTHHNAAGLAHADKMLAGSKHTELAALSRLMTGEKSMLAVARKQAAAIAHDPHATKGEKHKAAAQVAEIMKQLRLDSDLRKRILNEQVVAHKATALARQQTARKESARKALAGDLPTYLEAAASGGYTSGPSGAYRGYAGGLAGSVAGVGTPGRVAFGPNATLAAIGGALAKTHGITDLHHKGHPGKHPVAAHHGGGHHPVKVTLADHHGKPKAPEKPTEVHLHTHVMLDGKEVTELVQKYLLRHERRNSSNGASRRRSSKK